MFRFLKCVRDVYIHLLRVFLAFLFPSKFPRRFGWRKSETDKKTFYHRQPKPEWVRQEVIRLKALMPVFTSWLFRFSLWLIGVRHQLIEKACPWQNGKIERFFGTLKEKLAQWQVNSYEQLDGALAQFRFWYNHVRTHQNLDGRTPAEVWRGIDVFTKGHKQEYWFEAWDGLLTGFYLKL